MQPTASDGHNGESRDIQDVRWIQANRREQKRLMGERQWAEVTGGVQKSYDEAVKGLFIRLPVVLLATAESDPRDGPSPPSTLE
ncbi:hypothetical protein DPX16_4404 [Anabarilius grahami]|uniref:Uncharacterized protein n=1 Tax=Anabarilius grahami TaxID=495550 RepID=A0A3N0Z5Q5_ANAGA|nr:hypothetical protein DPX16_4404 [Anabarilius grahami]